MSEPIETFLRADKEASPDLGNAVRYGRTGSSTFLCSQKDE